jgi:spore coat protein U-like protein
VRRIPAVLAAAALIASLGSSGVRAATQTTTFQVTANVLASCVINSAGVLAFGSYTGVQADNTSTISVTCTNTTTYDLGLDAGTSAGATTATRAMTGPAAQVLNYSLFRDAARTLNWGNLVGTDTLHLTGTGVAQVSTVFGRIPAGQAPSPGGYTDTITLTLTF